MEEVKMAARGKRRESDNTYDASKVVCVQSSMLSLAIPAYVLHPTSHHLSKS